MDHRAGQEPIHMLGVVLGVGLALLILMFFGYAIIRWYQRGREYGQGGLQRTGMRSLGCGEHAWCLLVPGEACMQGGFWEGPDFVFSLYRTCGLGSVAVELVPPFTISGSLSGAGSSYVPCHDQGL
ncbi:small integral membrane protein 35 [Phaenicophaeus curvirostris]|uniref:small integral membrane protein 35 n=1 Tax=Phaenicophaeus curvirostris TaxID=33595 RepID=UPI0037F0BC49